MQVNLVSTERYLEPLTVDLLILNSFSQSKVKQTIAKEIFTVFTNFLIFLLISSSWFFINLLRFKARFISLSVFRISYICILLAFTDHIWLYLIIFNRSGILKKILDPNRIFIKVFLFVTGI